MRDITLANYNLHLHHSSRCLSIKKAPNFNMVLALSVLLTFAKPSMADEDEGLAKLACLIKPEMYVELSSNVDAIVDKLLVETGDTIVKGQPLVRLEASVEKARVNLAKIQAASDNEINSRKIQLLYAKQNKQHSNELYKTKLISEFENYTSDTEVALAEIELAKAIENKQLATLNLQVAETQLTLRSIESPINGLVVERYAMVGESVAERSIMKLAQIDSLRVELIAPTEYFGLINKGMEVEVYIEKPTHQIFQATVTMVDQLIDPASGSFTVIMTVPNPNEQLVSGVNCLVIFSFNTPQPSDQNLTDSLKSYQRGSD